MNYPSKTKKRRERKAKARMAKIPYQLVQKEVHGQMVWVKVYEPAWAAGDRREAEALGLNAPNPFMRARRGRALAIDPSRCTTPVHRGLIPHTNATLRSTKWTSRTSGK